MRTGRAAIFEAPNRPFVVREYPVRAVREREALVRVAMATICRSDMHSYEGRRPNPTPGILGHEIIGVIDELGAGVTHDLRGESLRVGDRVTWTEYFAEGDSLLPGTGILKLPPDLTDQEATPLNCGVATMISVTEAVAIGVGDAVVIQGLGLLGLYGVALAKARGARLVIGLDTVAARLAGAGAFGADLTIDASLLAPDDLVRTVRDACRPDGADAVIEVCGVPDVISLGLRMLRTGGRYTIAGLVNPNADITIDANLILRQWITVRGVHNYHPRHLVQALAFVVTNRRRLPFGGIVEATFSLSQLDVAFRKASERSDLRAAIVP